MMILCLRKSLPQTTPRATCFLLPSPHASDATASEVLVMVSQATDFVKSELHTKFIDHMVFKDYY